MYISIYSGLFRARADTIVENIGASYERALKRHRGDTYMYTYVYIYMYMYLSIHLSIYSGLFRTGADTNLEKNIGASYERALKRHRGGPYIYRVNACLLINIDTDRYIYIAISL